MKKLGVEYWEELARREPYFPVLDADGRLASTDEFFATGEADIAALLTAIRSLLGRDLALDSVLDFGCGAGRLTLPLARRAKRVVACDIAPTILEHARQNAERAGLTNITFTLASELPQTSFDFICSLAVFQYIAPSEGYGLIRSLARLLAPGGIAAIQLRFGPPREPSLVFPPNIYNERRILKGVEAAGSRPIARFPLGDDPNDAVLIVERL
ncbi:MAG TPA: class I SAM-dependent methyltransferase [Thermoanaerobaculia bacterium]|nr:class I SAM-dependent methyltransferase [Thermoanaerobaculia bacterium]